MKNKQMLANKNNAAAAAAAKRQEQILRTGRNMTNSELNAMARNRSGNSLKDLSGNRYIFIRKITKLDLFRSTPNY